MIKNYIMLIGDPCDVVLQHFGSYLVTKDCSVIYVDQNLLGITINLDSNYWYLPEFGKVAHANILSVYNRCMGFDPLSKVAAAVCNANLFLSGMLDYEYALVVNRPSAMLSNNSKPLQSYMLRNFGLAMPEYICVANAVISQHSHNMIYKSICAIRSIVHEMQIENKEFVKEPLLLQQTINGYNVRVHIVGGSIFATKITAKQIDYRYSEHNKHEPYNLPSEIKNICYKIANKLNLLFCGIDLIFMQGKYYFLEVNTAPGYNYYEQALPEANISAALYNLLIGEKNDFATK
jgi:hypothetical protein